MTWATPIYEATCRQLPQQYYLRSHSFAEKHKNIVPLKLPAIPSADTVPLTPL